MLEINKYKTSSGKTWRMRTENERAILSLQQKFNISDILARILVGRGVNEQNVEDFLNPTIKASLPDPLHLKDMDKAIERITEEIILNNNKKQTPIGIFGDYDVDGASSAALLTRYFRELGIKTEIHIPDREKEGYGPNIAAIKKLHDRGCRLIITVDCGTTAFEALQEAVNIGVDIIVLDHHMGTTKLPPAVAIVNPNRLDETSEHTYLAGVGVTFMTLVALNRHLRLSHIFSRIGKEEPKLMRWLDIVALGTICDVVPLIKANRALVRQGLKVMATRQNTGIASILNIANICEPLTAYHSGFVIGPRINAGGRVGTSSLGTELLSSTDKDKTLAIARQLERYNEERKTFENIVLEQAITQAEQQIAMGYNIVMAKGDGWHEGVIGIVAGRIKEQFDTPVAILSLTYDEKSNQQIAKASVRSVSGVDIGAAIISAKELGLITAGGGHAMAAGFSVEQNKIDQLHEFLNEYIQEAMNIYNKNKTLNIDAVLSTGAINKTLAHEIEQASPYGAGNPTPRLAIKDTYIRKLDIIKEQHIRLMIQAENNSSGYVKAMAFNAVNTPLGEMLIAAKSVARGKGRKISLAGKIKLDYWQGRENTSFIIDDAGIIS